MAIEMSSSQREMVHEQRPVMSLDLFLAVMKGDGEFLMQCLGLPKEQKEVKASDSAPEQINTKHQSVQSELQSATHFGDTVLHLLVTERHNELALKVFQRDMSLLKAHNKMLETPLFCAAKVGNEKVIENLIQIDPVVVKDALQETNKNGDTALHVAAKYNHIDVGCELMKLDPQVAYKVNNEMLPPLYIAIVKEYTKMVQTMVEVDPILACTKFSDGMFPVHVSARMGNKELVLHFMEKYPDCAELLDPCGRNLFHIAAEENKNQFFHDVFQDTRFGEIIRRMNTATDYEGNTPLHIAAMMGHKSIMRVIWARYQVAETILNKRGLTPLQLSMRQLVETNEDIDYDIRRYIKTEGKTFTRKWFHDVMRQSVKNKWERVQVIGLGSVLITTVTFAAAFTIPGGYNQDDGTPVLGRRYMFRAFILANALAFIQAFLSLFVLLFGVEISGPSFPEIKFASDTFQLAASNMVVAFGLGMYVTLAPVCLPIAILLLVITLIIGSPFGPCISSLGQDCVSLGSFRSLVATYGVSFLLIFGLAFT